VATGLGKMQHFLSQLRWLRIRSVKNFTKKGQIKRYQLDAISKSIVQKVSEDGWLGLVLCHPDCTTDEGAARLDWRLLLERRTGSLVRNNLEK